MLELLNKNAIGWTDVSGVKVLYTWHYIEPHTVPAEAGVRSITTASTLIFVSLNWYVAHRVLHTVSELFDRYNSTLRSLLDVHAPNQNCMHQNSTNCSLV